VFDRKGVRAILSIVPPFIAALLQHVLWPVIQPFAWFLFYPAVFVSSWIGGKRGGIAATAISTLLVWWAFVPPEHTLAKDDPRYVLSAVVFLFMGILFSLLHQRLRTATHQSEEALAETRLAVGKLQDAHDQICRLVEQASDGILIAGLDGHYIDVNQTACVMLGYSREEILGKSIFDFVPDTDVDRLRQDKERLQTGGILIAEWSLRRKDGTYLPVEVSAKILADGRWQAFARDITERKLFQARLQQINRANRALSKCNQALVRAVEEGALLQQVCDVVVQEAGYRLCWVGHAEHDDAKSVRVVAQAGWETDYLNALNITWADNERGQGPTGACIRTRQKVIAQDIAHDPGMAPWRTEALKRGYASSIAIPLLMGPEVFGALSIYAPETDAFRTEEIELLSELANDLAFGISSLRTRTDRTKAEEELRVLNAQLEQRVLARTTELQQSREREFEIGSKIQETLLLDRPPAHLACLRIAGLTLPTQRIDGDFYIFMEPREGSLDVIVGDVMGKGIPAALLGAATKAHLIKAAGHLTALSTTGKIPEPKEIVMLAHADIGRQLIDLESFVTLCYARIDTGRRVVEIVDCGHTGTIQLHHSSGQIDLLHGDNLPLGVREHEIYEQISAPLDAGDLLLFFSDGITEARNSAGELFGAERLKQCIREHGQLEPSALVEVIRKAVVVFCESDRLADDLTVVAVRVEEVGPPLGQAAVVIKSDLGQLYRVREFVRSFCNNLPVALLDQDSITALELAVNEAASNIMKHAYQGCSDQQIDIEAEAFSGRVLIRLYDQGRSFEPPSASLPAINVSRESGFGLYILSQSVDEVGYYRDERGRNCVALAKFSKTVSKNESETQWKLPPRTDKA